MEKYYCKKLFDISDALELLKEGYVLTRASWNDSKVVILLNNKDIDEIFLAEDSCDNEDYVLLLILNNQKYFFGWNPSIRDILAEDWCVVGCENEYGVLI